MEEDGDRVHVQILSMRLCAYASARAAIRFKGWRHKNEECRKRRKNN